MNDTASLRVISLPGQLRSGDLVSVPGSHHLALTEAPEPGTIVFQGQDCQIYYLTGRDTSTHREVKIVASARSAFEAVREVQLHGRLAPVFVRPLAEPEYASRSGAYLY